MVGSGKRILDIGCSDGRDSARLILAGNDVFGVEISEGAAKLAKQKGVKMSVLDVEDSELPFPDKYFDAIIACEIIEHLLGHLCCIFFFSRISNNPDYFSGFICIGFIKQFNGILN